MTKFKSVCLLTVTWSLSQTVLFSKSFVFHICDGFLFWYYFRHTASVHEWRCNCIGISQLLLIQEFNILTALLQCPSEIRFTSCENNIIYHYVQFRFIILQHWKCMLGSVQTCAVVKLSLFFIFMFMLFVETVNYLTLYNSFLYNYADKVRTFCTFFQFEECIKFITLFWGYTCY